MEFVLSRTLTAEELKKTPRVLDPACGSGTFLVEAFRRIVRHKQYENQAPLLFDDLKQILRKQIAGIEVNKEAAKSIEASPPKSGKVPCRFSLNSIVQEVISCNRNFYSMQRILQRVWSNLWQRRRPLISLGAISHTRTMYIWTARHTRTSCISGEFTCIIASKPCQGYQKCGHICQNHRLEADNNLIFDK